MIFSHKKIVRIVLAQPRSFGGTKIYHLALFGSAKNLS